MRIFNEYGYALPSVLMVSLLVITLLLGLLSVIFFYDRESIKAVEKKKLDLACYSALNTILSDTLSFSSDTMQIFIDSILVTVIKKNRGLFNEITTSSKGINDSSKISYLVGRANSNSKYFNNALVISRPNLRASVVGKTEISGDILATSKKFIKGNIFGEPPVEDGYHKGNITTDNNIPVHLLSDSLVENFRDQVLLDENSKIELKNFSINSININDLQQYKTIYITGELSFSENIDLKRQLEPITFQSDSIVSFSSGTNSSIDMNIVSKGDIQIEKNSTLENIVLITEGSINVEPGCYFRNVQLFSSDEIIINDSQFDYPSVIFLSIDAEDSTKLDKAIEISSSIINGYVILTTTSSGLSNNKSKIKIDKESKMQGIVYSENNLEQHGEVTGTVYTYNYWYYKEPNEYINWLINVKIDRNKLSDWFLLPIGFADNNSKQGILKETWIY